MHGTDRHLLHAQRRKAGQAGLGGRNRSQLFPRSDGGHFGRDLVQSLQLESIVMHLGYLLLQPVYQVLVIGSLSPILLQLCLQLAVRLAQGSHLLIQFHRLPAEEVSLLFKVKQSFVG